MPPTTVGRCTCLPTTVGNRVYTGCVQGVYRVYTTGVYREVYIQGVPLRVYNGGLYPRVYLSGVYHGCIRGVPLRCVPRWVYQEVPLRCVPGWVYLRVYFMVCTRLGIPQGVHY